VGEPAREPQLPTIGQLLEMGQLCASTILVVIFVAKTYRVLAPWLYFVEVLCVCMCAAHGTFTFARSGFTVNHAASLLVFLDCITLPATVFQRMPRMLGGGSWLTLSYLRTFHQLSSLRRLREMGLLERFMSDFATEFCFAFFELINVVVTISGTMLILETLGDIPAFEDRFWVTGMGDVSFFSMMYFAFITISTGQFRF
jgi:hypothetical protein